MNMISSLLLIGGAVATIKGLDNSLEVTKYTVVSEKLPEEFNNFKIVHISDIHSDIPDNLINTIADEHPDIICSTGDMSHDTASYKIFLDLLCSMKEIAPVYLISGNHDIWRSDYNQYVQEYKNAGGIWLQNESKFISRGNSKICIHGIEDPFYTLEENICENINKSLSKIKMYDGFNLLMFHRANMLDKVSDKGFDLILSGHMHGGQIRIPGIGGVLSPKSNFVDNSRIFFPKYSGGKYTDNSTTMIVSRGIGNKTFIPRFYNRPEVGSITLRSNKKR